VDSEFILLCERLQSPENLYYVHLLRSNLPEAKCTLLDSQGLGGRCQQVIFDYKTRHQFYLYYYSEDAEAHQLQACIIENSRLQLTANSVDFDYQFKCERVDGNHFQTFHTVLDHEDGEDEDEGDGWKDVYGEFKLTSNQVLEFQTLFDTKMDRILEKFRVSIFECFQKLKEMYYLRKNTKILVCIK
jgi:hypothetical protein